MTPNRAHTHPADSMLFVENEEPLLIAKQIPGKQGAPRVRNGHIAI